MATNPNIEGDGTALYISSLLRPFGRQNHTPCPRAASRKHHRIFQRLNINRGDNGQGADEIVGVARSSLIKRGVFFAKFSTCRLHFLIFPV